MCVGVLFYPHVWQTLYQAREDDGTVYVDLEGNDQSVRSATSAASGAGGHASASSAKKSTAFPKTSADPEKGVPPLACAPPQGQEYVVRQRSWGMRLYVRFCHFTPLLFMLVLVLGFAWLCSFDRPLALAVTLTKHPQPSHPQASTVKIFLCPRPFKPSFA